VIVDFDFSAVGKMYHCFNAGDIRTVIVGIVINLHVAIFIDACFFEDLDDIVYVEVFLEGELNPSFKRLRNAIEETLTEFQVYSNHKLQFVFTDPSVAMGQKARNEFMTELAAKGIQALPVIESRHGERTEKIVFPGALVSSGGFETGVMLFKGNRAMGSQEVLNQSIEGIEFELASAIYKISNVNRKRIGMIKGHGELDSLDIASFSSALIDQYEVFNVNLNSKPVVENYDVLVIAKPRLGFTESEKFKLDQYLMNGGKLLFLLDRLDAVMDSASRSDYFAFPYELRLEDQLFKYGIRINPDFVQDRMASKYPIVTSVINNRPQIMQMDWLFFPVINQYADHAITRNLDATITKFISSIDTVKATGVRKTPLLFSSDYSRKVVAPVRVSVNDLRKNVNPETFSEGKIPVAYLLEGEFGSLYKNRFIPEGFDLKSFKDVSKPTKIIVVADGDVVRNDVNPRTGQPQQLGFDPITQYNFANLDLLMNMIAYLIDDNGLIKARNKEVKIRPLDKEKIRVDRVYWQVINLAVPLMGVVIIGIAITNLRKRKYGNFK
ncbi:MAG: gliding motility-associated ABC transporter substrate-binding protein GldG, partial [Bacteroidia bacterium]|nr:gliding motility-associated ABC transporter substrate-binding protein GldG [Bacteroidia bacterium]